MLKWLTGRRDPDPFETMVAFAVAVSAAYWLISPSYRALSALGRVYGPLDFLWTTMYAMGGAAVLVSRVRKNHVVEVWGLILMGGGFSASAVSTALVSSPIPIGARAVSILLLAALALACLQRVLRIVWRGR